MESEIKKFSNKDFLGYTKLVKFTEKIFDKGFTDLAAKPFHSILFMIKQIPALLKLRSYQSVYSLVCNYISNEKLRRVFSMHPLLVGGNPFSTTSIYALIHFLERNWGVYFSMGGTGKLVQELTKLLERSGVNVLYNTDIVSCYEKNNKIEKIESSNGQCFYPDNVIFNGDPPTFYNEILKSKNRIKKRIKIFS